jgi:Na+/alanine symporter
MTTHREPETPQQPVPSCVAVLAWLVTLVICTVAGVLLLLAGSVSATSYDGIAVSSDALWQARLRVVGGMAIAGVPWLWLAVYRRSALALFPAVILLAISIIVAASLPSASDYTVF